MPDSIRLKSLTVRNLLSFGTEGATLVLQPLNVLIGPNAAGKSNLLETISLLQAAPLDLPRPTRRDGVSNWLWKGAKETPEATVEAVVINPARPMPFRHRLAFSELADRFEVTDEAIENESATTPQEKEPFFFYRYQQGNPVLRSMLEDEEGRPTGRRGLRRIARESLKPDQSILSQRQEPDLYPELAYLGNLYRSIRLYTEWNLGRYTSPRQPQQPDTEGGFLAEDASNLAIILGEARGHSEMFDKITHYLQEFYERALDIYTAPTGGKLQVYLRERLLQTHIPGTRLSDGTLRFLCLLVILCHPTPPPVIGIEEPELGMHPDLLPTIAELLIEASERTQLIVTTHSDLLISQFTERPEAVIVCDRGPDGTYFQRLSQGEIGEAELPLGAQWLKGQIGGTRW
ncbi:MAG: AAA family ATPase [Actinomycetota bacterium]